ncbi:hypothetical protein EVAR_62966_1 [Eumeta japonica]|uniref:Uncharacterized protein n=1 Tax=Eumeta variegata TaxID=151549 RepID=A0A4C1Z9X7_EUMVA|nr:hypothetical protein EVAR_62966_1 [Eumeta japonica]
MKTAEPYVPYDDWRPPDGLGRLTIRLILNYQRSRHLKMGFRPISLRDKRAYKLPGPACGQPTAATAAHGYSRLGRNHQCIAGFLKRNKISNVGRRGLTERGGG